MMVKRGCVEATGPLDPYLHFYWEEADFCRRARHQGWRVVLVPGALARHYAGGWSSGDRMNKETANQLRVRNFYIYKLVDPNRRFSANLIAALHLFLFHCKRYFPGQLSPMIFHVRILAILLREMIQIHEKWSRDRKGIHPAMIKGDISFRDVKLIRGKE
jgi:GT2 family glycosyltransferase